RMEDVLDLYAEAPDPERPLLCFDETPVQLIGEVRQPIPPEPGKRERYDYEYRRNGTVNLFVAFDPHPAWRKVKVTERRTAVDYAHCMRELVDVHYPKAACIRVVQDNLSIHAPGALYQAFAPAEVDVHNRQSSRQIGPRLSRNPQRVKITVKSYYWKLVHAIIQESVEDRDRVLLGLTLAPIKIERGKPFSPDARMQTILIEAERVGHLMMINEAFSPRDIPAGMEKYLFPGTQWEDIQIMPNMTQHGPNYDYATIRMIGFYQANGAQFAWDPRDFPPGFGQKYGAVYKDGQRNWLKGDLSYRLRVPPKVPVADFWAVTVYDVQTRALIEAPQR